MELEVKPEFNGKFLSIIPRPFYCRMESAFNHLFSLFFSFKCFFRPGVFSVSGKEPEHYAKSRKILMEIDAYGSVVRYVFLY